MPPRKKETPGVLARVDMADLHDMVASVAARYERRNADPVLAPFAAFPDAPQAARDMRADRPAEVYALLVLRSLERTGRDTAGIPEDLQRLLTVHPSGEVTSNVSDLHAATAV
jgi:hypothetical protein